MEKQNLPTTQELFADDLRVAFKNEQLNLLLNQEPKASWIKEHPYIKAHRYIPIDKIEYMLIKIFKKYRIEITGQGSSFNGVWVTVRVHYFSPASSSMEFHDGIGACQLQTSKGTSPADLANINNGAISMAFPIAKTLAVKDACDHLGKIFGRDLNRKDTIPFAADKMDEYKIEPWQITKIEGLIKTATWKEEKKEFVESNISFLTYIEGNETIKDLEESQSSPIPSGRSYNQNDIKQQLKSHI